MIEILGRSAGKAFGMKVNGKLLHRDYEEFMTRLEKLIVRHSAVRCLIEMTNLHGVELALWDEIKFDVKHAWQIERCAVVGDRAWEAWTTKLCRTLFLNAELRCFVPAELEQAWQWIEEGL